MIELDESLIHRNRSFKWRDACKFVETFHIYWGRLPGETIMDVGCGTGGNSPRVILQNFPEVEKIVATDVSEDAIRMAQELNPHPQVVYKVVDIQDEEANRIWFNTMTKVVSIHCFHWLQNQTQAFRNIYQILKPGGRAAIAFVLHAPNFEVHKKLKNGDKWKNFLEGVDPGIPICHTENYESSDYVNLVESIGFAVDYSDTQEMCFSPRTIEEFKDYCNSVCPLLDHIPGHLKEEFSEDLLEGMLDQLGRCADGLPNFSYMNMWLMLRKGA